MLNLCTLALNEEFFEPFSLGAAEKGKPNSSSLWINGNSKNWIRFTGTRALFGFWGDGGGGAHQERDTRGGCLCLRLGFNNLRIWGVQRFGVLAAEKLEDESWWSWWSPCCSHSTKKLNSWSTSRVLGMNHLGLWERYRNLRSKSASSFAENVGMGFLLFSMVDSLQSQTGKSPVTLQWFGLEYLTLDQINLCYFSFWF